MWPGEKYKIEFPDPRSTQSRSMQPVATQAFYPTNVHNLMDTRINDIKSDITKLMIQAKSAEEQARANRNVCIEHTNASIEGVRAACDHLDDNLSEVNDKVAKLAKQMVRADEFSGVAAQCHANGNKLVELEMALATQYEKQSQSGDNVKSDDLSIIENMINSNIMMAKANHADHCALEERVDQLICDREAEETQFDQLTSVISELKDSIDTLTERVVTLEHASSYIESDVNALKTVPSSTLSDVSVELSNDEIRNRLNLLSGGFPHEIVKINGRVVVERVVEDGVRTTSVYL